MHTLQRFSIFCLLLICPCLIIAQKTTHVFTQYGDTMVLKLDLYEPQKKSDTLQPCVIFVFGGGFVFGSREAKLYRPYFDYLTSKGYLVASIDYRLGLKGATKPPSIFNRKPLIHSIEMAVEDLYKATAYLLENAARLNIDTSKIIISGSSAGAITALQADYEKRNHQKSAELLPQNFNYAGIISFAGAIYSTKGKPRYKRTPAPMLFFHGDRDDFVPYKKISFLGTGIFGPAAITSRLKKKHHPYCFYTFEGIKHDASAFPMWEYLPEIGEFLKNFIFDERPLYIDVNIKDDARKNSKISFEKLYRGQGNVINRGLTHGEQGKRDQ